MPIPFDQAQKEYDNELPSENECEECDYADEDAICAICREHCEYCTECGTDCCGGKRWIE